MSSNLIKKNNEENELEFGGLKKIQIQQEALAKMYDEWIKYNNPFNKFLIPESKMGFIGFACPRCGSIDIHDCPGNIENQNYD